MRNRAVVPAFIVTSAVFVCFACGGDVEKQSTAVTVTSGSVTGSTELPNLRDLIRNEQEAEITYTWTGGVPEGGPGSVIFRTNGTLMRWDTVIRMTDKPAQGTFNVYRRLSGQTMIYGCRWLALPDDRSKVRADCVEGGSVPGMEAPLSLALLQGNLTKRLDDRLILGHESPWYAAPSVAEICVSDQGHVLYLSTGSAERAGTYEATEILSSIEPFSWPFSAPFTPTTYDLIQAADALDLPTQFHLSRN